MQAPPERLGSFYLGAEYNLESGKVTGNMVNYDARDLTTHAVCVGMTGSGKTGLCIGLLEEAAIDDVPTIIIDPKGDMTNLLLQFPNLLPADFEPWINPDDARRKGKTVAEYAASTADLWRNGLANWGIGPERMQLLKDKTQFTIYTPGSDAGVPISILGSMAAPSLNFEEHAEAVRERIAGTVAALLGLVGVKADPVRSREAILLSNIFEYFWKKNEDLDLAKLILSIQTPPVRQLGVFDVDTFYPQKDRFELAMAFNNLVASPSFQSWLQGEALDIDTLMYDAAGAPRHSIFYLSHLSDSERMFFVTLLLENILTWVRAQPGTTSLRAILYFDEIFGFFPPTAEPPSKRPLLTLLKQARAFGLGCMLVTQNPVDLDYKGLTNAGTWFIGKLQAERDKARVLQGLKGAIAEAGGSGKVDYDTLISQLDSRVFILHNVHEDKPVVFHTRWAMSYLRGPMTRPQVKKLMADHKPDSPSAPQPIAPASTASPPRPTSVAASAAPKPKAAVPSGYSPMQPQLNAAVPQVFLPVDLSEQKAVRQAADESGRALDVTRTQLVYQPAIVGAAKVRFFDRKRKIDEKTKKFLLASIGDDLRGIDWDDAESLPLRQRDLSTKAERVGEGQGPFFASVPEAANSAREFKSIAKDLADWLYYNSRLPLIVHKELGIFQKPGETERAFKIRLQQAARERRDAEVDKLEKKYQTRIERLQDKLRREKRELAEDEADYDARKRDEMVGIGESVLGFFMGRRSSRLLSRASSKRRMTTKAKLDIEESKEVIADLQEEIAELEAELKEAADEIAARWSDSLDNLDTDEITPRRTDVDVELSALAWLPFWLITYDDGRRDIAIPAYPQPEEEA